MNAERVEIGTPLTLKYGFLVAGIIVFVAGIVLMVIDEKMRSLAGLIPFGIAAVLLGFGVLFRFILTKPVIAFDENGLEFQPCKATIPWSHVASAEAAVVGFGNRGKNLCVCIRLIDSSEFKPAKKQGLDSVLASASGNVYDYHAASSLLDTRPDKIVEMMKPYLQEET